MTSVTRRSGVKVNVVPHVWSHLGRNKGSSGEGDVCSHMHEQPWNKTRDDKWKHLWKGVRASGREFMTHWPKGERDRVAL